MKKSFFVFMGVCAISLCNASAYGYCNDFSDVAQVTGGGAWVIANCTPERAYGDPHCATLDYTLSFYLGDDDGTCRYVESCATCPSGYELDSYATEYKVGDVCYVGDGDINGNDQDILDNFYVEYYACHKVSASCAAGYYGTSGCTQCPTWTGVYTNSARTVLARGTSIAGDNKTISDCYIASGTYYDATGTFKLNGICYRSL